MIVGLGFRARSGKDTIAEYLVKAHNFRRIGFADALKEGCRHIFGLNDEQLYGEKKEVIDAYWQLTPRYILQYVGTECMRDHFDKEIWVKAVEKKIVDNPGVNWVITDVRFPNEAQAVRKWNGKLVRVDRPLAGANGGIVAHPSEVAMEAFHDWDYILKNDINVHASLYDKIEDMLAELDKPKI